VENKEIKAYLKKGELFMNNLQNNWHLFVEWFKKSLAMMIVFILIGASLGIYVSKIVYDMRMNEVTKVGGFVYDNTVYNVSLRP
jgi:hypothetical protein